MCNYHKADRHRKHSVVTVTVSLAVFEMLRVKLWRGLEIWIASRSGSLKVAPFSRSYSTYPG